MLRTNKPSTDLETVKHEVDGLLARFFEERISLSRPLGAPYERLWQTMQHLSSAGGKRLRPYMVRLAYEAFQGDQTTDIMPVAAAWELLHLCMLIHDDIIDNDFIRYGVPNIAGAYKVVYAPLADSPERKAHLATSAAILAGDLAHSSAHEMIIQSTLSAEQKILAQRYLTAATFSVAGGELLDTESVLYDFSEVDPVVIAKFKTASYSFVGPLSTGAALAGASEYQLELLERFGAALGEGFQFTDDLLGLFGDEIKTGKSTTSDIREGKRTFIMQYAFRHAGPADRRILDKLVGKQDISLEEVATVKSIVNKTGARQATDQMIEQNMKQAHEAMSGLEREGIRISGLERLIMLAVRRQH